MNSISIAFVDSHPVTVDGLRLVFGQGEEHVLVATGGTSQDMLTIADQHQPALLVVDLAAPGNVLATISAVAAKHPNTKIIVFTAAPGVDYAVTALEAGARGYVSKSSTADELLRAARAVMAGETYVSQNFASGVIAALRNASVRKIALQVLKLSVREDQIVQLLMQGMTNKAIAAQLGITEKTVKHYMTVLMQKLNVSNRVEALIAAQKLKPSEPETKVAAHLN